MEDRPVVKLGAVAEHDFASDNPKVLSLKAKDVWSCTPQGQPRLVARLQGRGGPFIAAKYVRVLEERRTLSGRGGGGG